MLVAKGRYSTATTERKLFPSRGTQEITAQISPLVIMAFDMISDTFGFFCDFRYVLIYVVSN